ncbi:MAG: hypothetical protein LBK99_14620 [Opitutaceae bacterium]|jgi:hypothetical protein|nr:hypothetical protein [Opitutaceae bacterium]
MPVDVAFAWSGGARRCGAAPAVRGVAGNQSDATGFIRLNGLRLRARNLAQGGPKV